MDTSSSPHIFLLLIVGGLVQYVLLVALFRAESHLMRRVIRCSVRRASGKRPYEVTTASDRKPVVTEDGDLHPSPFPATSARRSDAFALASIAGEISRQDHEIRTMVDRRTLRCGPGAWTACETKDAAEILRYSALLSAEAGNFADGLANLRLDGDEIARAQRRMEHASRTLRCLGDALRLSCSGECRTANPPGHPETLR